MRLGLAFVLLSGCFADFDRSRIPGEQNAIGFGAIAMPGMDRCDVTTLDDSGPGSLRACLVIGADVHFDVSGVIDLLSPLEVPSRVLVRGESSPAGITLAVGGFPALELSSVQNVVVRGLRMEGPVDSGMIDVSDSSRVLLTSMTIRGGDVGVTVSNSNDLTVSHTLFSDLQDVGVKVQSGGNRRVTIARNVCHRTEDMVRVQGFVAEVQIVNNIGYGWAWFGGGIGALTLRTDMSGTPSEIDVVRNVILQASGTASEVTSVRLLDVSDVHARDNRFEGNSDLPGDVGTPYTEIDHLTSADAALDSAGVFPRSDEERGWLATIRAAL